MRRIVLAWIIGVATFLVLVTWVVPDPTCADGWDSPSIGTRGACSWHGGVRRSPWALAALLFGVACGVLVAKGVPRPRRKLKQSTNPMDSIRTPYGSLRDYQSALRARGVDEGQIQIEVDKYLADAKQSNRIE